MRWPVLNQDHVASKDARRVRATPRVSIAPEYDGFPISFLVTQNVVQHDGKSVEVTDV